MMLSNTLKLFFQPDVSCFHISPKQSLPNSGMHPCARTHGTKNMASLYARMAIVLFSELKDHILNQDKTKQKWFQICLFDLDKRFAIFALVKNDDLDFVKTGKVTLLCAIAFHEKKQDCLRPFSSLR